MLLYIVPPQHYKICPQRRPWIYVWFYYLSIVKYLKPLTCDILLHDSVIIILMRQNVSILKGIQKLEKEITWNTSLLFHSDSSTNKCELEVKKTIHLQKYSKIVIKYLSKYKYRN